MKLTTDKHILIIGPCSADHSEPVLEYISRLRKVAEHVFGKSITDPCLGWEKTEKLIFDIADKL